MSSEKIDAGFSGVLKKLGAMTAIRDTYMVEQSLLRTLGPLLGVLQTAFYRLDDNGGIARALFHSRKIEHQDGVQTVAESMEEVSKSQELSGSLSNLFESVRLLGKACTKKTDSLLEICYPIYGNKELVGYFVFQRDRELTPVEDAVVNGVLEVFTNYFDLLDASQRDQLTGLLNRYSLEINLDRLWNMLSAQLHHDPDESSRRVNVPETYWLGMIDIDHFKKINDTYGHVIGDEVLIMVTRLLQSSLRQSDLLYRYGGEEFVAIIAANDLDSATQAFERARLKIEQFEFPQVGKITISGGFSKAEPGVLPQEIMNRADSSLYASKNAGRNRIFFYDALVNDGILKEAPSGSIDLF